jgi:hypothetical protein
MAKISHTKIKQPSFGEKRPKLTYTKISRFTVLVFDGRLNQNKKIWALVIFGPISQQ